MSLEFDLEGDEQAVLPNPHITQGPSWSEEGLRRLIREVVDEVLAERDVLAR